MEIVNSDQYICTVDAGGKIDMEITVGRGRGYRPAKDNKPPQTVIDFIPIDSIYTPVQKVNYNVEPARVGQNIDYDRLTIEVWTDGTFSGKEIVSLAAKIMQDHINLFVNLSDTIKDMDILVRTDDDKQQQILSMKIEDMDFSVRSYNCLKRANIHTVEDLCQKFSISRSSLQALFRANLGMTPKQYISELKLNEAKKLISQHEHTISQVSDLLGFTSIHYFSRRFKSYFGIAPSEYAREH